MPGLPAASTLTSYGAPAGGFSNAWPVVNPATDWDAGDASQMMCDVAGMTRTAQRFFAVFKTGTSSGAMTLTSWGATWGAVITNPPPALARTTTGLFTCTLPQLVSDEIGNVNLPVNISRVGAFVQLASLVSPTLYIVEPALILPYQLGVALWTGGSLNDGPVTIHIWGA